MRFILPFILLGIWTISLGQVSYTANDQVQPYTGVFRQGINFDYYPPYSDIDLANIAAGNPSLGLSGIGATTARPALFESFMEAWGYDSRVFTFQHMKNLGMTDMTCIVGFPSEAHRDHTVYCSDGITESALFANLYTPIWDDGENGTPYNDENYYAAYLYKTVSLYKDHVKFWEIWNEPGFDLTWNTGWRPPGDTEGNWWDENPDPCDYVLHAPIEHFIRTMRISYEIIKTVDPDAYVVLAGVGFESFLDAMLRNTDNPLDGSVTDDYPLGGGAYFDVMGFHTYPDIDGTLGYFDAGINDWVRYRHSDAAVDGMRLRQEKYQDLLAQYGYDGITYPKKEWIVTENNTPRVAFSPITMASEESQINYILKTVVTAMRQNIRQIHPYQLADRKTLAQATDEYDLMGMYLNFTGTTPYQALEKTKEGIAYKSSSDALFKTIFDTARTAQMNIPDSLDGGAFLDPINNRYVYVLWAKTTVDLSEEAEGMYSFPAQWGDDSLILRQWDYSETHQSTYISPTNIPLNGRPIYLFDGEDVDFGELTLVCPDTINMEIPSGDSSVVIDWTEAYATTTCPMDSVTSVVLTTDLPSGSTFTVGPHTVGYEATDSCGNYHLCSFPVFVTMEDTSFISIQCPDDIIVVAPAGEDRAIVTWEDATGSTNCIDDSLTIKQVGGQYSGATFVIGGHTIGYQATDLCGNTSSCQFLVTVQGAAGSCPNSILAFTKLGEQNDHGYYLSQNKMNWQQAQSLATSSGGYIASVNSLTENEYLQSNINSATFIGLNDAQVEGDLVWDNGDSLDFTNYNSICDWCGKNTQEFDYAVILPWDGTWAFESRWTQRNFILEMNCIAPEEIILNCPNNISITTTTGEAIASWDTPVATSSCSSGNDVNLTQLSGLPSGSSFSLGTHTITYQASDICENNVSCNFDVTVLAGTASCDSLDGFTLLGTYNGHGYYLSDDLERWEIARLLAENQGGYLATMNDSTENSFVQSVLGNEMAFIGYSDAVHEGLPEWVHQDAGSIDFSYDNDEDNDYAVMNFWAGTWGMVNYQVRKKYIMEMECNSNIQQGCGTKDGFEKLGEWNGNGYYISDQKNTWNQAQINAQANGGHLATIHSQEENDFIQNHLANNMAFVGYQDAHTEGIGEWGNQEPVDFDLSFDNSDENDYAVINFWAGTWQMVNELVIKKYIMEVGCPVDHTASSDIFFLALSQNKRIANLTWQIKEPQNTAYFIIERAIDGLHFEPIAQKTADQVNRLISSYHFTDAEPLPGFNFYRIVAVSLTGKQTISNVTQGLFAERQNIALYPNPAGDHVQLDLLPFKGKKVNISLTNQLGIPVKMIQVDKVDAEPLWIDLPHMRNGIYQVNIQSSDHQTATTKLVIAKSY
ncbi:MAG TPA: HYR domain-containing protein [Saprospiraceae bacterium]|nr:HYR domain-containing protein [Saprospiraceae bacterium]